MVHEEFLRSPGFNSLKGHDNIDGQSVLSEWYIRADDDLISRLTSSRTRRRPFFSAEVPKNLIMKWATVGKFRSSHSPVNWIATVLLRSIHPQSPLANKTTSRGTFTRRSSCGIMKNILLANSITIFIKLVSFSKSRRNAKLQRIPSSCGWRKRSGNSWHIHLLICRREIRKLVFSSAETRDRW